MGSDHPEQSKRAPLGQFSSLLVFPTPLIIQTVMMLCHGNMILEELYTKSSFELNDYESECV